MYILNYFAVVGALSQASEMFRFAALDKSSPTLETSASSQGSALAGRQARSHVSVWHFDRKASDQEKEMQKKVFQN